MSRHFQITLDENIPRDTVFLLRRWITVGQVGCELGRKAMDDEEIIPRLLLQVGPTTFITQDQRIYKRELPHSQYCILVLPEGEDPDRLATFARAVLRTAGFRTVRQRMGRVARVSRGHVVWKEPRTRVEHSRRLSI